jgi:hypothetical protein
MWNGESPRSPSQLAQQSIVVFDRLSGGVLQNHARETAIIPLSTATSIRFLAFSYTDFH